MTSPRNAPAPSGGEAVAHLAVQVTALRGLVSRLTKRLDSAGIIEGANLADRFEELARTVAEALDKPPLGPAAPTWTGLDDQDRETQLTGLRQWVDVILRTEYGGYQLADCWDRHPHAIWELSTLAAQWQRIYTSKRPSLDEALKFYDRWLPGTMRRLNDITIRCRPECVTQTRPRTQGRQPRP